MALHEVATAHVGMATERATVRGAPAEIITKIGLATAPHLAVLLLMTTHPPGVATKTRTAATTPRPIRTPTAVDRMTGHLRLAISPLERQAIPGKADMDPGNMPATRTNMFGIMTKNGDTVGGIEM